jgi:enoyl-CoA hydratase/carnithine racemase
MTTSAGAGSQATQPPVPALEDGEWRHVRWEFSQLGVLSIVMNKPERLNALNYRMLREMQKLVEYAATRSEIRVVTLRGEGTVAFCSGDDLKGMEPHQDTDSSAKVHHQLLTGIRELDKPVVALITGWALGHGFELACACDIRLCADNIEVGDHRVTRAIALNGGSSWQLPRIIGRGRAMEMLLTGRHMLSDEALAWGWANHVWPMDLFEEESSEYIRVLANLPTQTVAVFKAALEYSASHGLRDSLAREVELGNTVRNTYDAREGRSSFHEKRTPVFKGR